MIGWFHYLAGTNNVDENYKDTPSKHHGRAGIGVNRKVRYGIVQPSKKIKKMPNKIEQLSYFFLSSKKYVSSL